MPKPPSPWFRSDRRAWYVQLDNRQVLLARESDHATARKAEAAARAEFHRLMATRAVEGRRGEPVPLGILAARFFEELRAREGRGEVSTRTRADYWGRVERFIEAHARTPCHRVGPTEMDDYLAGREDWGPNRRVDFVRVLSTIYRWGRRRGLIDCPPPEPPRSLPRKLKRDKIPTWPEVEAILAACRPPEFADFSAFVAWTGCRPSEAASVEAKHVEADLGAVVLTEHKTRRKTGAPRVILTNEPSRAILGRLMEARPVGPLFRNARGNPWGRYAWRLAFDRARERAGVDPRVTLYSFRHARATGLLLDGAPLADVAAILGNDPAVTGRTYNDVVSQREHLRSVAARGVTRPAPPPAPTGTGPPPTRADGGGETGTEGSEPSAAG